MRHRDGLVLAAPERMCFDLTLGRRLEDGVAGVDAVLHRGLTDTPALSRFLTGSHEQGVRHARRVLELSDGRAESPPESVVRVLLVRGGLRPVPQCEIRDAGGFVARVDLGFEEEKIGVEYEGRWHGAPQQVPLDRWRLNRIHAAGWRIVFVTAPQLRHDRAGILDEVHTALRRSARLRALAVS
jgi:very-short-patch-repair endonuclease